MNVQDRSLLANHLSAASASKSRGSQRGLECWENSLESPCRIVIDLSLSNEVSAMRVVLRQELSCCDLCHQLRCCPVAGKRWLERENPIY